MKCFHSHEERMQINLHMSYFWNKIYSNKKDWIKLLFRDYHYIKMFITDSRYCSVGHFPKLQHNCCSSSIFCLCRSDLPLLWDSVTPLIVSLWVTLANISSFWNLWTMVQMVALLGTLGAHEEFIASRLLFVRLKLSATISECL